MPLPSSGPLTLANIQTEFGGSNPISLSEYYAGGGLVPAGTSGTYGAVPSSGTISIRNFYGTSNFLDQQTITTGGYGPDPFDPEVEAVRGYIQGSYGSCVDGTSNIYSGATIAQFLWRGSAGYVFNVNGSFANSGWTTLTIVGNGTRVLTRASAFFVRSVSTSWTWSTADDYLSQAFGDIGATAVCTFT